MGAVQTADPHDSSPSINILWSEKLDISKKHPSLTAIHNIAFSIENVFSSELGEESAQIQALFPSESPKHF